MERRFPAVIVYQLERSEAFPVCAIHPALAGSRPVERIVVQEDQHAILRHIDIAFNQSWGMPEDVIKGLQRIFRVKWEEPPATVRTDNGNTALFPESQVFCYAIRQHGGLCPGKAKKQE